jgi:hypothetical protein
VRAVGFPSHGPALCAGNSRRTRAEGASLGVGAGGDAQPARCPMVRATSAHARDCRAQALSQSLLKSLNGRCFRVTTVRRTMNVAGVSIRHWLVRRHFQKAVVTRVAGDACAERSNAHVEASGQRILNLDRWLRRRSRPSSGQSDGRKGKASGDRRSSRVELERGPGAGFDNLETIPKPMGVRRAHLS